MAGVLNFTLGMQASQFLGGLNAAGGGMNRLLGVTAAVAGAFGALTGLGEGLAGVMREINQGASKLDLSRRTGESVKSLTVLSYGFEQVGLSADGAVPLIAQMQKALGGMNEQGEPTNKVFEQLGLNIEELKGLDAPAAIQAITGKLAGLDKSTATNLAGKIFGRSGAGDALQIARSGSEFGDAIAEAEAYANTVARNAAAWKAIGDTITSIKLKSRGFFANIAEGATPGMQMFLDEINKVDFSDFGKRLGQALAGGAQAFKEGGLSDLVGLCRTGRHRP